MKKTSIFALAVLAACSLMACNDSAVSGCQNDDCTVTLPGPSDVSGFEFDFSSHKLALAKADSCDDYRAHLLDELAVRVADSRFSSYHYCGWLRLDDVLEEGMQPGAPSDSD